MAGNVARPQSATYFAGRLILSPLPAPVRAGPAGAAAPAFDTPAFRLAIAQPGMLDRMALSPLQRRPPQPGEVEIADGVRGLHRRDDAELREARDVVGVDDLSGLDAKARLGRRPLARR